MTHTVWSSLDDLEQEEMDSNLSNAARGGWLSCFAHTLQLCIGDGLNETKGIIIAANIINTYQCSSVLIQRRPSRLPLRYMPTISLVVPTVLALNRHLTNFAKKAKYLKSLTTALKQSLRKQYRGVFSNVGMEGANDGLGNAQNFGETVYLLAAVLDPTFAQHWLVDVYISSEEKEVLCSKIKGTVLKLYYRIYHTHHDLVIVHSF